ncbi:MAG: TnpV protein [Ruminococcus sp.]
MLSNVRRDFSHLASDHLKTRQNNQTYGKYGMLRKQFLKEHRSARYQYMLLTEPSPTSEPLRK